VLKVSLHILLQRKIALIFSLNELVVFMLPLKKMIALISSLHELALLLLAFKREELLNICKKGRILE